MGECMTSWSCHLGKASFDFAIPFPPNYKKFLFKMYYPVPSMCIDFWILFLFFDFWIFRPKPSRKKESSNGVLRPPSSRYVK